MGLFDFLYGKEYESEAEAYMKKRNKEYARKCAAYKKQEMMGENGCGYFGHNGKNTSHTAATQRTAYVSSGIKLADGLNTLLTKLTGGTDVDVYHNLQALKELNSDCSSLNPDCSSSSLSDSEKQAALKKRLQEKYGHNVQVSYSSNVKTYNSGACDSCDFPSDDVNQAAASIFEINTAQKMGHVIQLCGKIARGRFEFDDTVVLKTNGTQIQTKVLKIVRQGSEIGCANISSGVIVVTIPDVKNIMIHPGDQLTKNMIG
jgi:hypothetical protein